MKFKLLIISILVLCAFSLSVSADSTGWNDTTVINDSAWNDTTIIDDSTWDDTTVIDDSTWNDTTVIDDSIWNDTTIIDDSTWNDTSIIDDSTGWIDTNYYDDTSNYIYDSLNDVGVKFFWEESVNISINDISIEVLNSPWGKLILESKVLKEIILNISDQNKEYLDSSWISVKYNGSRNRDINTSVKLAYFNEENQSWEVANTLLDTKNQRINAYLPATNKVAVIEGDNITPISNVNSNYASNLSINAKSINLTLKQNANVKVELFNMTGQKVATLFSGNKNIGTYNIKSNKLNSLAVGNYVLSLKINGQVSTSKLFNVR